MFKALANAYEGFVKRNSAFILPIQESARVRSQQSSLSFPSSSLIFLSLLLLLLLLFFPLVVDDLFAWPLL
jgi:hypothetical protein